jgi:hypothetical protein
MPRLRTTKEFQANAQVLRVDCLGNLVDDMRDDIVVAYADVPAFISWLTSEHAAVMKFGVTAEKSL